MRINLLLGSKPLSEMSLEEMQLAIEELRGAREALREAAIKQKKETGTVPRSPRAQREPKQPDPVMGDILKGLMND